jgi:hypothetical protein
MDKVHKSITTQYYTASSKPFRIYLKHLLIITNFSSDRKLLSLVLGHKREREGERERERERERGRGT